MKNFKLVFSWFAKEQLDEAMDYYSKKQEGLGDKLWQEVMDKSDLIEQNPYLFQKSELGTRIAVLKKFPFRIFYRIKDLIIEVVAILHQSRDTKYLEK